MRAGVYRIGCRWPVLRSSGTTKRNVFITATDLDLGPSPDVISTLKTGEDLIGGRWPALRSDETTKRNVFIAAVSDSAGLGLRPFLGVIFLEASDGLHKAQAGSVRL